MKRLFVFFIIFFVAFSANSQFYNGLQMTFGKNRVQYKPFNWNYYRFDDYDIYTYERGLNLGKYVAENIEQVYNEMSDFFGVELNDRVLFIVYNKLTDFRQSNIGLETENVDFNIGGTIHIQENKVFVYYEGNHQKFDRQIRKVIAKMFVAQVLYGTAFTDKLTSSALLNVPEWFEKGLISYMAQPYNIEVFDRVKDFLQNKKKINFNHLSGHMAEYVGHTFWYYIAENYTDDAVSNILYFSKISKNINNAINFVLGYELKDLTKEWRQYYEKKIDIEKTNLPDDENEIKLTRKKRIYQQLSVSPKGDNIAYVENNDGKYKVFIYNINSEKKKKIYKEGHKLEQIVDKSYPVLAWNPNGKVLAFTTEKESNVHLWLYNIEKEEKKSYVLPYISKVLDFSFAPNGNFIAFSAVTNGFTDIFVYNLLTGNIERITSDLADDLNPVFNKTSGRIIFSSNRTKNIIERYYRYEENPPIKDNFDLYYYDFKNKSSQITQLSNTAFSNEIKPVSLGNNRFLYLSDSTGRFNRFVLKYDSSIAYVDTTVHYKYFSKIFQNSDYAQNLNDYDLNSDYLAQIFYNDKKNRFYLNKFSSENLNKINNSEILPFKKKIIENKQQISDNKKDLIQKQKEILKKLDSLKPVYQKKIQSPDSSFVDINNYKFEVEKDTLFKKFYYKDNNPQNINKKDENGLPKLRVYKPTFYLNDLQTKIDFTMLNQSYQPFTGGPFYFNPGMSVFSTISVDELFNNYKLIGGFRFGFNGSMEYLLSAENLKKRLDKQIVYHRQSFKIQQTDEIGNIQRLSKSISNEFIFIFRYPFNQVSSIKTSLIGKYDRNILLSLDYNTLVYPDTFRVFSGAKLEYIFDNSRELSLNLIDGIKFKIFSEFYQQVHGEYDYTAVLGTDFRFYQNIFRKMTFASRIGASTSFGSGKVIYYLGGVDNWLDLSFGTDKKYYFDKSVNINPNERYLFQAVATNMRGFSQNIRNGNSFVVINNELRIPFLQMFFPYPLNSDFWHNLQLNAFFDIGSAWSGLTPYDEKNFYNVIIQENETFTVIVDVERPPFVYGYGLGLRSKLLGYFVRLDFAWGVEGNYHHDRMIYLSLSKDF